MKLYPLKFNPIFKEKLWGGTKIKTILNKDFGKLDNCGESWEISGVKGNLSVVSEGVVKGETIQELIKNHKGKLVGEKIYNQFGDEFPLLIKFIDAKQDLSIQVHPNEELAQKKHNGHGKTEMWYVLQTDKNAKLISGFNKKTSREEYLEYFNSGKLIELLNKEEVNNGDVFFLPAGRVHTIGKGLLLAEIQQTSDITYRIYDFDRKDKHGNKRELHVEEALDAIDYSHYPNYKTPYENQANTHNSIIKTPYFTANKLNLDKKHDINHTELDSFKVYICTKGEAEIITDNEERTSIQFGETVLMPACIKNYAIEPKGKVELLETYIEL